MHFIRTLRNLKKESNATDPPPNRLELEANVTVVSAAGCGKTSLLLTGLRNGGLNDSDRGTSAWKCYSGTFTSSSHVVRLNVCDTPGMEEYKASRKLGYTEGISKNDIVVIMFQLNRHEDSKELNNHILPEIQRFCPDAPKLLVGCQLDHRNPPKSQRHQLVGPLAIQYDVVTNCPLPHKKYNIIITHTVTQTTNKAIEIGAWGYVECSAKTRVGVAKLFETISQMVVVIKAQPRPEGVKPSMPFFEILPDASSKPKTAMAPMPYEQWVHLHALPWALSNQTAARVDSRKRPYNLVSEGQSGDRHRMDISPSLTCA
ncbi:hypothetical protein FRC09_009082 [Ceratobasidium sp. 395]|nr:hypothetical protein FRC09_009082 [Ceratobasidium sp. 395]